MISGGQTGVDRAALDVAMTLGVACGGWCPKGRRAEDGILDARYPLIETPSDEYAQRTEWNVRDADGTLIVTRGTPSGGTAATMKYASRLGKPCLVVDLAQPPARDEVIQWVKQRAIRVLNVAGPRESQRPGMYAEAVAWLRGMLSAFERR